MQREKSKETKAKAGATGRGQGGRRGWAVRKVKLGAGTLRHKASSVLAAGSGRARWEHVQRLPRGRGAGNPGREAAGSLGTRLLPPRRSCVAAG